MTAQPPYPLHETIVHRINPEYAAFYNEHLLDKQQVHLQPVEASRTGGVLIPGAGPLQPVASTVDYDVPRVESQGPDVKVRCFTPLGERPEAGWPVCIYFHGGGWVLGTIATENAIASNLCARGKCVVVAVDYRYSLPNSVFLVRSRMYRMAVTDMLPGWLPRTRSLLQFTTRGRPSSGYVAEARRF